MPPTVRTPVGPLRRPAALGFLIGFLLPLPAAVLALLFVPFERLLPWLTPGGLLLQPLAGYAAGWPGVVNMLLVSVANGLVFAVLAVAAVAAARALRSRG